MNLRSHHPALTVSGLRSHHRPYRAWLRSIVVALVFVVVAASDLAAQSYIFDYTGPLPVCPGQMTLTVRERYWGFQTGSFRLYMLDDNDIPTECNASTCGAYISSPAQLVDPFPQGGYYRGAEVGITIANPGTARIRFRLCFYADGQLVRCVDFPVKNIDATAISGPTSIPCCSEEPVTYCLSAPDGADSYRWTLPPGWTEISRSGNCITVRPVKNSGGQILGRAFYDECDMEGRPIALNIIRTSCEATMTSTPIPCGQTSGGSASASAPGGVAPFTYAWFKNGAPYGGNTSSISGLTPGTYSVTITDATGCIKYGSVVITDPASDPALNLTITTQPFYDFRYAQRCWINIQATVTGGTPPYTYDWGDQLGNDRWRNKPTPGTYSVTITDARGCTLTRTLTYDSCMYRSAQDIDFDEVMVTPNPTDGIVFVGYEIPDEEDGGPAGGDIDVDFDVVDHAGTPLISRTVTHQSGGSFQETFDLSGNPAGPYFIRLSLNGGAPVTVMVQLQ